MKLDLKFKFQCICLYCATLPCIIIFRYELQLLQLSMNLKSAACLYLHVLTILVLFWWANQLHDII